MKLHSYSDALFKIKSFAACVFVFCVAALVCVISVGSLLLLAWLALWMAWHFAGILLPAFLVVAMAFEGYAARST